MSSRRARILSAVLGAALATAAMAADAPWLAARQDEGEVRFTSRVPDDPFSFRIPGRATQQGEDGDFVVATIDGAAFAFGMLWLNPDQDSLDAVVNGAKAHARELGATVASSGVCEQAKAVHREWSVSEPSGTRTLVVAFEAADGALAMRVVDDAGKVGAGKLRAACASFERPKNDEASTKAGPEGEADKPGAD